MSYKLLTNLLFEPRGKHNSSLTYNIKDTVMSEDGSKVYFALDNVPAGIPLTDTNYWMLQMDLSSSKNAMDSAAAIYMYSICVRKMQAEILECLHKFLGAPI